MFNSNIEFVIARGTRNGSGCVAPALNVVPSSLAWELFFESVIEGTPVSVRPIDRLSDAYFCDMIFHAGSINAILYGKYGDNKKIYVNGNMALDVKPEIK